MSHPQEGDYIDIHVHDGRISDGIYILESLMAHENRKPEENTGVAYTYGIHPWFLTEDNQMEQKALTEKFAANPCVIAIGEAGFDKLRGPSMELQKKVFEEQVQISESLNKPLIIHCVRAWDELISVHKKMKPKIPWMIHGFRGKQILAEQLLSKGFYLSFWFDFALRPESSALLKEIAAERIFLETDGADTDIRDIYSKVAADRGITTRELKTIIYSNFLRFFTRK